MKRIALGAAAMMALFGQASADKASADAAFAAAKKLMAQGKPELACPKFEISYKEDPQLGSLLNLADCDEQVGKLATAWAEFREAAEVAGSHGDAREAFAKQRAGKLEPRLSHLIVHKDSPASGVVIRLDSHDVSALVDIDMPVDPGAHTIESSGGGQPTKQTIDVTREGMHLEITVRPAPEAAKPVPPGPPVVVVAQPKPPTKEDDEGGDNAPVAHNGDRSRRHKIAIVTGVSGLVIVGVGLYFGNSAFNDNDASKAFCDANQNCQQMGRDLIDSAKTEALESDILVGVGAAAVVASVVLWVTAPQESRSRVAVTPIAGPHLAGATLTAHF